MGSIWRSSDGTGNEATYTRVFIQCINGWDHMTNDLWYHWFKSLSRDVHPTAQVEIPPGTDGKLTTEYLTNNGQHIIIIGKSFVNGSVQFTSIPEG